MDDVADLRTMMLRWKAILPSSVSAIHACVQHHVGDVSFLYSGKHFLTFGATFFSGATLFFWRDFSLLARLFSLALNCRPLLDLLRT